MFFNCMNIYYVIVICEDVAKLKKLNTTEIKLLFFSGGGGGQMRSQQKFQCCTTCSDVPK